MHARAHTLCSGLVMQAAQGALRNLACVLAQSWDGELHGAMQVCVHVCACVCVHVRACVHARPAHYHDTARTQL